MKIKGSIILFIAALVWGLSFVVQSVGGKEIGAITFNAARMLLGALVLRITMFITDRVGISAAPVKKADKLKQLKVGILCGLFLFVATNLQQIALNMGSSAGKAGFLSAVYIIIVPFLGLLYKKRYYWNTWAAVGIGVIGLYFLCIEGEFRIETPDILLLISALGFALQIVMIDRYGGDVDSLRLSGMQFLLTGVLSTILAVIIEVIPYEGGFGIWLNDFFSGKLWISLLYMGVMSCGVGYSFQIFGQKYLSPTVASLIMSLEAVFSVIFGWLILGETLVMKETVGCALLLAAVILAQLNFKKR